MGRGRGAEKRRKDWKMGRGRGVDERDGKIGRSGRGRGAYIQAPDYLRLQQNRHQAEPLTPHQWHNAVCSSKNSIPGFWSRSGGAESCAAGAETTAGTGEQQQQQKYAGQQQKPGQQQGHQQRGTSSKGSSNISSFLSKAPNDTTTDRSRVRIRIQ